MIKNFWNIKVRYKAFEECEHLVKKGKELEYAERKWSIDEKLFVEDIEDLNSENT